MPGMSAWVSRSISVMEKPSPISSSFTLAPVFIRRGVMPARESCAVSAIVKHPAWAAPISSSGLVADWPSSNRDLNEYGPSNAPLPTFSRPLPSARLPFHSASAFRVGIKPPFDLLLFVWMVSIFLFVLLRSVTAIDREGLSGNKRRAVGTEPDDGACNLFRLADAPYGVPGYQYLPYFRRNFQKHSCLNRSGCDDIYSNILFRVFQRDRFGQPDNSVFAGNIDRSHGEADQPRNGRAVDDGTPTGFEHRRNLML